MYRSFINIAFRSISRASFGLAAFLIALITIGIRAFQAGAASPANSSGPNDGRAAGQAPL